MSLAGGDIPHRHHNQGIALIALKGSKGVLNVNIANLLFDEFAVPFSFAGKEDRADASARFLAVVHDLETAFTTPIAKGIDGAFVHVLDDVIFPNEKEHIGHDLVKGRPVANEPFEFIFCFPQFLVWIHIFWRLWG